MTNHEQLDGNRDVTRTLNLVIKVGIIIGLFTWCFLIIRPFVMIVLWGLILAVTVYPAYRWLKGKMGGRKVISASLVTLVLLLLIMVPVFMLGQSLWDGVTSLRAIVDGEKFGIPPPSESIKTWPVIGNRLFIVWDNASRNLESTIMQFKPQIRDFLLWVLQSAKSAAGGFIMFLVSIFVSGFLLVISDKGGKFADELSTRLAGNRGSEFARAAEITIRSVARGILGVAVIQAGLAGLGFLVAGVPGAGLWAMIALFLGIIQIGVLPVCFVVVIYMFFHATTFTAVALMIWCILIGPLDNILKPIMLGRGATSPMAVIFLGAIGGFLLNGIIGLFVGAVVLSMGYNLFILWLREGREAEAVQP
jgi:predicted PurR-regulated permease PerM